MEIIINQALIDILVAKGIFTQEELMAKIEDAASGNRIRIMKQCFSGN